MKLSHLRVLWCWVRVNCLAVANPISASRWEFDLGCRGGADEMEETDVQTFVSDEAEKLLK